MNILTIDFDWIMGPCIEAYNNFISEDDYETRDLCWEDIHKALPEFRFTPDLNLFENVWELCETHKEHLYIINSHEQVIPLCPDQFDTLINIDHHHDWYSEEKFIRVPNCATWAQYLWERKRIKKYIWICNTTSLNSLPTDPNLIKWDQDPFVLLVKYPIDKCILCKSEYWLSDEGIQLWDILTRNFDFINKK